MAQEVMFWETDPEDVIEMPSELNSADYKREWRGKKDNMEKATGGTWTELERSPRPLQSRSWMTDPSVATLASGMQMFKRKPSSPTL